MTKPFKFIGSISSGTLRPEDLIPRFLDTWEQLELEIGYANAVTAFKLDLMYELVDSDDPQTTKNEALEELIDKLNGFSPPYFYFGAHPGDGADFGFWFDRDAFEQAVVSGELMTVDDALKVRQGKCNYSKSIEYYAVVSDHGNVTLYDLEGNKIWGIV